MQVTLTAPQRTMAAANWQTSMAPLYERRAGPRKLELESTVAPATLWNPQLPGVGKGPTQNRFVKRELERLTPPSDDDSIAYAPVTRLAEWIQQRQITSERLTEIYLERLERFEHWEVYPLLCSS